jgi:hypothetical protein
MLTVCHGFTRISSSENVAKGSGDRPVVDVVIADSGEVSRLVYFMPTNIDNLTLLAAGGTCYRC